MSNYGIKILNFLKDKNKKPYIQIIYEGFKCMIQEKELPRHYLTRLLYKKGVNNYMDYMGVKRSRRITDSKELHNSSIVPILENKLFFYNYFSNNEMIKMPKTVGYNYKSFFYYNDANNERMFVKTRKDLINYINNLFKELKGNSIFIKPIDGIQGNKCFKFHEESLHNDVDDKIFYTILSGNFIFQETIKQDSKIDKIYPGSINTIRMDVYTSDDGESHLLSSLMRFGVDGNFVDNISAGGFFVPIDIETGRFKKYGMQLLEYGGNIYTEHPNTNFVFEDFKLPYFQEAKEMAMKASSFAPNKLVGWDVAISNEGATIVEGNHNYSLRMSEMAYGGYRKHPIFKSIIEEYG